MTVNKTKTKAVNKKSFAERIDALLNKVSGLSTRIQNAVEAALVNFDYTGADGEIVFSIDGDADVIEVGTVVTFPDSVEGSDGDYELSDGRIVTIVTDDQGQFVVSAIEDPSIDAGGDVAAENARLRTELENVTQELENIRATLTELRNETGTNFVPQTRVTNPGAKKTVNTPKTNENRTVEDIKREARERAAMNVRNKKQEDK